MLDIGSHSAQLQVVDLRPGMPPLPVHAVKAPTLLGDAYGPGGAIDTAGLDRVATAARHTLCAAHRLEIQELYAFTTAAVRDASNRDQILSRIEHDTGIRPQYLTGEAEARLTYLAARRWYGWSAGRLLLIDIGGASTEIVLGRDDIPNVAFSLPLGAGRLTREFLAEDPPNRKQLKVLRHHIEDTLREVTDRLRWEGRPDTAIATSETFKQLARLTGAPSQHEGPFVHRTLAAQDLAYWLPRLAKLPTRKRAKLDGINPTRAWQVLAGAQIAKTTMDALHIPRLQMCPWALREGIMLHHLETKHKEAGVEPPAGTGSKFDQAATLQLQPICFKGYAAHQKNRLHPVPEPSA